VSSFEAGDGFAIATFVSFGFGAASCCTIIASDSRIIELEPAPRHRVLLACLFGYLSFAALGPWYRTRRRR